MKMPDLITLQNDHWQAGILPGTGASIAFGRVWKDGAWLDLLRPTAEADYGNSSKCASFLMLPWCNRIKDGLLRFDGQTYPLRTTKDDGTARHGDVRGRAWKIESQTATAIHMSLRSVDFPDMNWPFAFEAEVAYALDEADFVWTVSLKNVDQRPIPAGFGHHPYFIRPAGDEPLLTVPCDTQFELVDFMAVAAPVPAQSAVDFRAPRLIGAEAINHVLSGRTSAVAGRLQYPAAGVRLSIKADALFEQVIIYTPPGEEAVAVEPMTNVNDGFNLYAAGIPGSGVFVLEPGETRTGTVRLTVEV
jgi:aldose 1-epimerase